MSKLQSEALREAISVIVLEAKEKKRNFIQTVELQIGLKNYDPQKDKRFSGSVKLPHIPRPKMKVCMLGDAQHVEEDGALSLQWCKDIPWKGHQIYLFRLSGQSMGLECNAVRFRCIDDFLDIKPMK